jgi:hypothetical protein
LSAWPTNALAIPMAVESCSGSRNPAAKLRDDHNAMQDTVAANADTILFMKMPPCCSVLLT